MANEQALVNEQIQLGDENQPGVFGGNTESERGLGATVLGGAGVS